MPSPGSMTKEKRAMHELSELERVVVEAAGQWADAYVNFQADYEHKIKALLDAVLAARAAQGRTA